MQTLLLGTALTRAGATSTKSGTWLREMALRAMPGSALQSDKAFAKHEDALHRLGLVDDKDRPTWFTNGKPDLFKMIGIASDNLPKIPLTERAALERQLFGAQGAGGLALLADPAVREQVQALSKEMNSPEFKARYGGFTEAYAAGSTVQNARTALQEFNTLMQDLGQHGLPAINVALHDFKGVLESIRSVIPGGAKGEANILGRAVEGAGAGALAGALVAGPFGAAVGGLGGGALGAAGAYMLARPEAQPQADAEAFSKALKQAGETGAFDQILKKPPVVVKQPPVTLNLNIDGRTLSRALSEAGNPYEGYATQAPAGDTLGAYAPGHDNTTDK
jgi:hypothetical protein